MDTLLINQLCISPHPRVRFGLEKKSPNFFENFLVANTVSDIWRSIRNHHNLSSDT